MKLSRPACRHPLATQMFTKPLFLYRSRIRFFTFSNEENSINMAEERNRNVVHATSDIANQSSFFFVFFFLFFLSWMESVPYWLKQHERASSFEHV